MRVVLRLESMRSRVSYKFLLLSSCNDLIVAELRKICEYARIVIVVSFVRMELGSLTASITNLASSFFDHYFLSGPY